MAEIGATINTGIDKLRKLVEEHYDIGLVEAAKTLKIPRHVVMMWAEALEEEGLVVLNHSFGDTRLVTTSHHNDRSQYRKSLMKQIKTIVSDKQCPDEHKLHQREKAIEQKEQEIAKMLAEMQANGASKKAVRMHKEDCQEAKKELKVLQTKLATIEKKHAEEFKKYTQSYVEELETNATLIEQLQKECDRHRTRQTELRTAEQNVKAHDATMAQLKTEVMNKDETITRIQAQLNKECAEKEAIIKKFEEQCDTLQKKMNVYLAKEDKIKYQRRQLLKYKLLLQRERKDLLRTARRLKTTPPQLPVMK